MARKMSAEPDQPAEPRSTLFASQASVFRTTRWNIVRQAQQGGGEAARDGLEQLARTYWYPLYAFARRQGLKEHDAQDLTQSFLSRLLTGGVLQSADPTRGRFRSFLLACFKNFLADERERSQAVKRGGGVEFVPLNRDAAEERFAEESAHLNVEDHYDRDWAQSLMSEALDRLREDARQSGKKDRHDALEPFLVDEMTEADERMLRKKLALGESGLRSALQRMRFRLGEYLWTEVARTVCDTAEVEAETRYLLEILSTAGPRQAQ
jgi:RNA polymerase sigma-70 factor (ECF subfamily)